jgi:CRP-like cAMP-binding protein
MRGLTVVRTQSFVAAGQVQQLSLDKNMTGFHAYAAWRARALGVEAACNARHTALQRLAKWIARLHAADGEERGISITQGELADMLGVQRTSVNAACRHLQDRGALRIRRARLVVLDQEELSQAACDCDVGLADGAAERRLRNRLN